MPVTVGELISQTHYNTIQSKVESVLGPNTLGYGDSGVTSVPVAADITITALQWSRLYNDLNRCYIHQTGASVSGTVAPLSGNIILASFVNSLEVIANTVTANKTTVHPSQLLTSSVNGISNRTESWGTDIQHSATHTWGSAARARYFFNLGGKIAVSLSYAGSTGAALDLIWVALVNNVSNQLVNSVYSLNMYITGNPVVLASAVNGVHSITVTVTKVSGTQLETDVLLATSGLGNTINLNIYSTISYSYSIGTTGGVPTPERPQVISTSYLGDAGDITPSLTRILTYSPSPVPTFGSSAGDYSSPQTITLTNVGNTSLTITGLSTSLSPGIPPLINSTSWSTLPANIAAGGNATFVISYIGLTQGSFNTTIVIQSNADGGTLVIPVSHVVSAPVFNFSLSPSSWSRTITAVGTVSQKFTIIPTGGSYSSYTVGWRPGPITGFTFTQGLDGPTVKFDSTILPNGGYAPTLSVTVNGITRDVAISLTLSAPESRNLGSWMSATAYYDAAVGMSYDIISGVRYLTIGIGASADGAPAVYQGGRYLSATNLGINADSKYNTGLVLYPIVPSGSSSNFLNTYGSWIRYNTGNPQDVGITRTYKFSTTVSGTHSWDWSVDDNGYFSINGSRQSAGSPRTSVETGTVFLIAGEHTVLIYMAGTGSGPTGAAVRIKNPQGAEVWSTLVPQRNAYLYWSEVYRIPLTRGAFTYQSFYYIIKDTMAANGQQTYGNLCGQAGTVTAKSIFTVVDDGFGNLRITTNPRSTNIIIFNNIINAASNLAVTIDNLVYNSNVFYYYSEYAEFQQYTKRGRLTNLEGRPLNGLTNFFQGFNASGTVRTSLVTYLKEPPNTYQEYQRVCPAPWHKILMADETSIPAGELQVGMKVRTQHQTTLEWGDYEVIAVSVHSQPRMEITFDHIKFVCSLAHKFYLDDQWIDACDLTPGMILSGHTVESVAPYCSGDVVKITVDDAHTYVCEGILAHNKH